MKAEHERMSHQERNEGIGKKKREGKDTTRQKNKVVGKWTKSEGIQEHIKQNKRQEKEEEET